MFQLVATALALIVAAPVVAGANPLVPESAELIMPDDCCCPQKVAEPEAPAEIERACCCELEEPRQGSERPPMLATSGDLEVPAAALAGVMTPTLRIRAPRIARRSTNARAPPTARSLLAQRTALLL